MWLFTECDFLISLCPYLPMEAVKIHFRVKDTWDFHLKGKEKSPQSVKPAHVGFTHSDCVQKCLNTGMRGIYP